MASKRLLKNLPLSKKLTLFAVVPVLGALGALLAWSYSAQLFRDRTEQMEIATAALEEVRLMQKETVQIQQWLTDISATRGQDGLDDGFVEAEAARATWKASAARLRELYETSENEEQLKALMDLEATIDPYYTTGKRMAQAYINGGPAEGNKTMSEFDAVAEAVQEALEPLAEGQVAATEAAGVAMHHQINLAGALMGGSVTLGILGFIISFLVLGNSQAPPLRACAEALERLGERQFDVTLDVDGADEVGRLGEALRRTAALLREAESQRLHDEQAMEERAQEAHQAAAQAAQAAERAQAASRRSDKLVAHLKGLPIPLIEIDRQFNITFINEAGAALAGRAAADCVGSKCYRSICGDHCQTSKCAVARAMTSGRLERDAMRASPVGGERHTPVAYGGVPILDPSGQVVGGLEFIHDLSDTYAIVDSLKGVSSRLGDSARGLNEESGEMATASVQVTHQAELVAEASEVMTRTIEDVAHAIDEINISLSEVAESCAQASVITANAKSHTEETSQLMSELVQASREIGEVTYVIRAIADQTNLLALNATIEAAGAGELGKGFAVVATEIKTLSKQTAEATERISRQVKAIQTRTQTAVSSIESVRDVVAEVNSITLSIAAAVEEQSATTTQIAAGMSVAAEGATEVNGTVTQMSQASVRSAQGSQDVRDASEELSDMSDKLTQLVATFRL